MAAGSSTLPNNETVTLKLPSGEMVDAVVPAGYSDDQVKLLMQMKRPDLIAPPGVPRPPLMGQSGPASSTMQPASLAPQPPTSYQTNEPAPTTGMAGWEYRHPVGSALAESGGIAALGTGGELAGAGPVVSGLGKTVLRNAPGYIASAAGSAAIEYARKNIPGGKYIPPGAEILPWLLAGGKGGAGKVAAKEGAGAAAAEAVEGAEAGARVPVGKLAKEVPNPDPYKFKGAPSSMDIVDSTNVGKVGYEPDSRTMTVEYKNGFVYSYHGVPQEIYQQSKEAESIGSYISRNVKGRYETVRRGSVLVKKR